MILSLAASGIAPLGVLLSHPTAPELRAGPFGRCEGASRKSESLEHSAIKNIRTCIRLSRTEACALPIIPSGRERAPKRLDPPATTAEVRVKLTRVNPKLRARTKDLGESLHFKPKCIRVTAPTA